MHAICYAWVADEPDFWYRRMLWLVNRRRPMKWSLVR